MVEADGNSPVMKYPIAGASRPARLFQPVTAGKLRAGVSRGIAAKAMEDQRIASKPPEQRSSHAFAMIETPRSSVLPVAIREVWSRETYNRIDRYLLA